MTPSSWHARRAPGAAGSRAARRPQLALLAAVALGAGCTDFLTVENPNVIDASAIDNVADAAALAGSAQQNFALAYGWHIMYSSWYSGETQVAETFPTRNEFGLRAVVAANGSLNTDVWQPISRAAASAKFVLDLALPTPESNINYARSHLWRGYSFILMGETFCRGTVDAGPALTPAVTMDSAVAQFDRALAIARANAALPSGASPDAANIIGAALVGQARAHLNAGRRAQAITAADAVPANFSWSLAYIDDLANRTRLGNRIWQFTLDRGSISVAPFWRVNDPRVPFQVPGQHSLVAQDANAGPFVIQRKYTTFAAPIRVASKLEADFIKAEASQSVADQLALINARRAAAGQPAYAGPTDAESVLTELLTQKGFEFYLEGKRMGDFRRLPNNVLGVPQAGAAYFKPGFPTIGNGTCYPLPLQEVDNNENLRGT